jgi:hypothetical protein
MLKLWEMLQRNGRAHSMMSLIVSSIEIMEDKIHTALYNETNNNKITYGECRDVC